MFGKVKGVFSPLGGSGFAGCNREKIASILFEESSREMVEKGICTFSLSRYAHDEEVGRSFIMNGFGIRCSDAIMRLSDRHIIENINDNIDIVELKGKDKLKIDFLRKGLVHHLADSPVFFPTDTAAFDDWSCKDDIKIAAAKMKDNKFIGYMAFRNGGETFISNDLCMYSLCGAYVDKEYRGNKIAEQLLEYICKVSENEGKTYLGVDCETLNPTALRFWRKYFDNYTYSYSRRIDERVIGYKDYLDNVWK